MSEILLTTTVGSFGKPDYLQTARNANARGKLSDAELLDRGVDPAPGGDRPRHPR